MRLLDRFRKAPAMTGRAELEDFLDRQAAFMVQKCIYEYARARSGVLSSKLFKEPAFKAALEIALAQLPAHAAERCRDGGTSPAPACRRGGAGDAKRADRGGSAHLRALSCAGRAGARISGCGRGSGSPGASRRQDWRRRMR